jgi:hypothetical protein
MEPEVRERFERIEATLALSAENHRLAIQEIDKRHKIAMDTIDKEHRHSMANHKAAMARMDNFEKKLESTRKLVAAGIGMVTRLAAATRAAQADTKALKVELRAFIKAQGNGHRGPNGRR